MPQVPLVSVIITSFNREKFIAEAIESVLASTYTNFELIIVDDKSTDDTVQIVREFQQSDPRIQLYINNEHLGDYPNRNKAVSYTKGKYIKFVDSDDYIYPYGLKTMVETMEQYPDAAFGICAKQTAYINKPFPYELTPSEAFTYHYLGAGLFYSSPVTVIIRSDIFAKAKGFLPTRMVSDLELWLRIAQMNNVVLMQEGLVWLREHEDREWIDHKKYLVQYEKIKLHYLKHEASPLQPEIVQKVIKARRRLLLKQTIFSFLKLQWRRGLEHLQLLHLYRYKTPITLKSTITNRSYYNLSKLYNKSGLGSKRQIF